MLDGRDYLAPDEVSGYVIWCENTGEGARATRVYFPAAALPSSLASMVEFEQTS